MGSRRSDNRANWILKPARLHRREMKRFVKFSLVGAIGFVIDTSALNIMVGLLGMSTPPLLVLAKAVSFLLALTSNFIWNRYWIYPEARSKQLRMQAAQFALVNLLGLLLNIIIFVSASTVLIPQLQETYGFRTGLLLGTNTAQVCAVGVVLFWNFFANRYWTYRDVD